MSRSSRVINGQQSEFLDLNAIVLGMIKESIAIGHGMNLGSLNLKLLQSLIKINISFDTANICWSLDGGIIYF